MNNIKCYIMVSEAAHVNKKIPMKECNCITE